MNKPTWNRAPEWANYLAQDENGNWYWYEDRPLHGETVWVEQSGRAKLALSSEPRFPDWRKSLEARP